MTQMLDAAVVGSGPNGLAAAIALARAGHSVSLYEAAETIGGGCRTKELTLPGFRHDMCAAVHPLAVASPFLRTLPLAQHGLEWVQPETALAHPFDDGSAVLLQPSLEATASSLGQDAGAYRALFGPLVAHWRGLLASVLGPMLRPPKHPLLTASFGLRALQPAGILARRTFREEKSRAVFAGLAAHANVPLNTPFSASFALLLGAAAHTTGWPIVRGGSQALANAMASYFRALGGQIATSTPVEAVADIPAHSHLLDTTPRQAIRIASERMSGLRKRRLQGFRYGNGVFKVDYALDDPVPWRAQDCLRAATVHLGGSLEEIEASELAVSESRHPERPYVILAQPTLFDAGRAPENRHIVWAYCHVPSGSTQDMTPAIEAQIERFAPGFRHRILARHTMTAPELETYNPNYIGGDTSGGSMGGLQLFFRPLLTPDPYEQARGLYLCSASTPPGPGVHGMSGYFAAQRAMAYLHKHT
jgi:phytoene dehydrogenase-like protein